MNDSRLNTSDAPNEVYTELKAARVCSRLSVSSASSDEQDGRLLKERATVMHERKYPTFHMISSYATKGRAGTPGITQAPWAAPWDRV
eukprot:scaffold51743_cov76-Phaeocystis_antarctica.AAC.3